MKFGIYIEGILGDTVQCTVNYYYQNVSHCPLGYIKIQNHKLYNQKFFNYHFITYEQLRLRKIQSRDYGCVYHTVATLTQEYYISIDKQLQHDIIYTWYTYIKLFKILHCGMKLYLSHQIIAYYNIIQNNNFTVYILNTSLHLTWTCLCVSYNSNTFLHYHR